MAQMGKNLYSRLAHIPSYARKQNLKTQAAILSYFYQKQYDPMGD